MQNFLAAPESFGADTVVLTGDEYTHATRSCRVRIGEEIGVTDGAGRRLIARISHIDRHELTASVTEDVSGAGELPFELTIGLAVIKASRFETAVEKCTELGVRRIVPLMADRCEPNSAHRLKHDRLARIALSAAKQAGRSYVPVIDNPCTVDAFLESADMAVIAASQHAGNELRAVLAALPEDTARAILIGPEGDFSDREYDLFETHAVRGGTLGGLVLRAETAAMVAAAFAASGVGISGR